MPDQLDCEQARDLIPEIAAGVAPGDTRADALHHIAGCADCHTELAESAGLVDSILLLAPAQEPPPGFESQVLTAIGPVDIAARRHRWPRAVLTAAAVAVTIALASGIAVAATWNATADDRRLAEQYRRTLAIADGRYLVAAKLTSVDGAGKGIDVGRAFAYEGKPSWVFVTVTEALAPGPYVLHVITEDGHEVDARTICHVADGASTCGTAVPVPIRAINRLELRATDSPPLVAVLH